MSDDKDDILMVLSALQYADEEIQTHLELGTPDTIGKTLMLRQVSLLVRNIRKAEPDHELSNNIDTLLEILGRLEREAREQVSAAQATTTALAKRIKETPVSSGVSLEEIAVEIKRRNEINSRLMEMLDTLDDDRTPLKRQLAELVELLRVGGHENPLLAKKEKKELERRLASLDETIEGLEKCKLEVDREIKELIAYTNAVRLVSRGLRKGIIGKVFTEEGAAKAKNKPQSY